MKTIQGPAIFLAQFLGDTEPFNTLDGICGWAANLGFRAIQMPTNDVGIFDLSLAAESHAYCDDLRATLSKHNLQISELSTHLQGQLIAVHPAFDALFDRFAPIVFRGNEAVRRAWATDQLTLAAKASSNLGLTAHATFSGALAWPFFYPWPQRPAGLVEEAFAELAKRWLPILDVFEEEGVDLCFELHPGEDLHDGVTFERFLAATGNHPRAGILFDPSHLLLQHIDYLSFIDHYHRYIRAFHVKDAEYYANGRSGVYGGYQEWVDRPGRFRTPGSGQIDFAAIFSKLALYDYPGWATLEWEDPLQCAEDGARQGLDLIQRSILRVTDRAFDNFAATSADPAFLRTLLGLDNEI